MESLSYRSLRFRLRKALHPGDHTSPTQPVSALSYPCPPPLTGRDMWGATIFDQLACRIQFHRLRYDGRYTPPQYKAASSIQGTSVSSIGAALPLIRRENSCSPRLHIWRSSRSSFHEQTTRPFMCRGKLRRKEVCLHSTENFGAPFAIQLHAFTSPLGIPCQAPPWGYVAAADLRTGRTVWEHKNGTVRDLYTVPLPFKMGVPNLGGPIVTAGGLAFLSGTLDDYVRA